MPGPIITEAKTQPDALSIVRFGTVSLKAKGMKEQIVKQGDLFGEMALLGLTMDGLRMRTAKAVTVVEICSLSAKDFEELLVVRPGGLVLVRELCRLHLLVFLSCTTELFVTSQIPPRRMSLLPPQIISMRQSGM
jgi:CRP-like cAMP-binding protein